MINQRRIKMEYKENSKIKELLEKDIIKSEDVEPLPPDLNSDMIGKIFVLKPRCLKEGYKEAKYQLCKIVDGKAFNPFLMGDSIVVSNLEGDSKGKYQYPDFIGYVKLDQN